MIFLLLSMCLVAALHQSTGGQVSQDDLKTTNVERQNEIVDKHNDLRRRVEPPARNMVKMMWSSKTAENAQKWADKCILDHSPRGDRKIDGKGCGENLFMGSTTFSWSYACESWYNETKDFKYGVGALSEGAVVGHYTQLVWALSWEVGCAYAYCPNQQLYKHYYVCQYCPAGNVSGKKNTPYKKGTPCADCPNDCDNGLCTNPCKHVNKYSNCDDLVKQQGCSNWNSDCMATCGCTTEIK